jgi:tRNA A-37 threonylcarbamoyl transferase component Bud32
LPLRRGCGCYDDRVSEPSSKDDVEATITAGDKFPKTSDEFGIRSVRPGGSIGRFEVRDELGSGGMGVVYVAYDRQLNRKVAIKVLHHDVGGADGTVARERMLREAQAMAQVTHTNVVTVYDVGTFDGRVFIAMEYVRGQNFREWLAKRQPGQAEVVAAHLDAARGLAAAHAAGLVHRDFKPDNVLMGDDGVVRVVDFGLATTLSSEDVGILQTMRVDKQALDQTRLTQTGAILGTPAYMAPEQFEALPAEPRTDQFAWCVAIFEALYGHRPFAGETLHQLISNVLNHQLTEPSARARAKVPRRLDAAIRRGLSRRPEDRFASMADLLEAITSRRAPTLRSAWIFGVAVIGLGIAGAGLMWSMNGKDDTSTEPNPASAVVLAPGPGRTRPSSGVQLWIGLDELRMAADNGEPTRVLGLDLGQIPADALDNHVVLPLDQVLRNGEGDDAPNKPDPIVLFIDRRVPWVTIEDILYSTLRAGYLEWEFAVDTDDGPRVFSAVPPKYVSDSGQMRRHATLQLWIDHDHVEVGTQIMRPMELGVVRALDVGNGGCQLPRKTPAARGLVSIAEIGSRLCDLSGVAMPVWFSAAENVSWGDVAATLDEVLVKGEGPCDGELVIYGDNTGLEDCASPTSWEGVAALLEEQVAVADVDHDPRRKTVPESIRGQMSEIDACYERALADNPSLESKLDIELGISASGSVTGVNVSSGDVEYPTLTACIGGKLFSMTFEPAPEPLEVSMSVTMSVPSGQD